VARARATPRTLPPPPDACQSRPAPYQRRAGAAGGGPPAAGRGAGGGGGGARGRRARARGGPGAAGPGDPCHAALTCGAAPAHPCWPSKGCERHCRSCGVLRRCGHGPAPASAAHRGKLAVMMMPGRAALGGAVGPPPPAELQRVILRRACAGPQGRPGAGAAGRRAGGARGRGRRRRAGCRVPPGCAPARERKRNVVGLRRGRPLNGPRGARGRARASAAMPHLGG
jgi:hypothetical protein